MRVAVQDRYGPPEVIRIEERPKPEPGAGEVLIRVRAATVSQTDAHMRNAHPAFWRLVLGFRRPRGGILGIDLAGVIEAVGPGVRAFDVGDEVFGLIGPWMGTHAEYIVVKESAPIVLKPPALSFEEAAAIGDGGSQALATLRRGKVEAGTRVVVYGASGSLGTAAVQLAETRGAHVTAVTSTKNIDLVRSLGANDVIDYTREALHDRGPIYDVVIDAVGKYAFHWGKRALKAGGTYVETDFGPHKLETLAMWPLSRWIGGRHLTFAAGRRRKDEMQFLKEQVESGAYRPIIDRRYPLDQVVEAHRHVEGWQKVGNVVLTL